MKMKNFAFTVLSTVLVAATMASAATRVYAPLPEVINVHPDYQYATARVLQSYVDGEGKYQIILPARQVDGIAVALPSRDSLAMLAAASQCPNYLVTSMTRLGDNMIISFTLYNTADGTVLWQDRLKAANPEDIDPIVQRIARALGSPQKTVSNDDIYSVTENEQKTLRQKRSNNSFGVALGGTVLPGDPYNHAPFIGGIGLVYAYDTRSLIVDLEGDLFIANKKSTLSTVGINVWKPLNDGNVTPYMGGGLALGMSTFETNTVSSCTNYYGDSYSCSDSNSEEVGGLLISAGGGLLLNRTSSVNLRLDLRYTVATYEVAGSVPNGAQIRLIASFGR